MIICSCHNIDHKKLEEFIKTQPSCDREQLCRKTKAGTDCGICLATIEEMLLALGKTQEKNHNRQKSNYWEQA